MYTAFAAENSLRKRPILQDQFNLMRREHRTFWYGLLVGFDRGVNALLRRLLGSQVAQELLHPLHDVREGGPELRVHLEHMIKGS